MAAFLAAYTAALPVAWCRLGVEGQKANAYANKGTQHACRIGWQQSAANKTWLQMGSTHATYTKAGHAQCKSCHKKTMISFIGYS